MKKKTFLTPLQKPSLDELLAEKLKAHIIEKKWIGTLPGIRTISDQFGVSTLTVKSALTQLEKEGYLAPAQRGKPRQILSHSEPDLSSAKVIVLLRPHLHLMSTLTSEVYKLITKQLDDLGVRFKDVGIDVKDGTHFSTPKILHNSNLHNIQGVILCDVVHDKARNAIGPDIPILVMGPRLLDDPNCCNVALYTGETLTKILKYIFSLGLKYVPILQSFPTKEYHSSISRTIEQTYEEAGLRYREEIHLPFTSYSNIESVIKKIIEHGPPSAIICFGNDQWCYLTQYFQARGIRTEVFSLFESPLFRLFKKPPYVCQPIIEDYSQAVCDWLAGIQKRKTLSFTRKVGSRLIWEKKG